MTNPQSPPIQSLSQPASRNYADRLVAAIRRTAAPVVVGLDPRFDQLPHVFQSSRSDSPGDRAQACRLFCLEVIDVVKDFVPAVKPQAACFEQFGPAGMTALYDVMQHAGRSGLIVILDGKRNDIGSTAAAYAEGYLGASPQSPWGADALTVSPYLGEDSLTPFIEKGQERGAGLYVLVKTSNPGGGMFQDLLCEGKPLYRYVAQFVEQQAVLTLGECNYGAVGAVVGATYPDQMRELREVMPHTFFLVPGFGIQGGTPRDVAFAFDGRGLGAIVNNSRGIIFAHSRKEYAAFGQSRWQEAVAAAAKEMIAQLRADTTAGRLSV